MLPTGRHGRVRIGLQAASFMKAVQVVQYTREALAELEGRTSWPCPAA
ncbi:histidinol dehydrogenase [Kocuria rhizophila]|nr:histidinol dehydrogenase [Kocuria rhizophila]